MHATYRSLIQRGFDDTSYRSIAEETGRQRSLVQYYFPKKEDMATSFLQQLTRLQEQYLANRLEMGKDDFIAYQYTLAQLHYFFLTSTPQMQRLVRQMLTHRSVISEIIENELDWTADYLADRHVDIEDAETTVVVTLGGIYELLYYRLRKDRPINAEALARQAILNMYSGSAAASELEKTLAAHRLTHEQLLAANHEVMNELVG
ncbi:MAG: TetR/AcrR family transcriptional regulator [Eggerthellaceae bacterium]